MKDFIRSCVFGITLIAIFITLVYLGSEKYEDLGNALLVVGAFITAGVATIALWAFVNWLFGDSKPAEEETPTEDQNQDATT